MQAGRVLSARYSGMMTESKGEDMTKGGPIYRLQQ